jgi:hypothetical protein
MELEPLSGEEMQKLVVSSGDFPAALIDRAKQIAAMR